MLEANDKNFHFRSICQRKVPGRDDAVRICQAMPDFEWINAPSIFWPKEYSQIWHSLSPSPHL